MWKEMNNSIKLILLRGVKNLKEILWEFSKNLKEYSKIMITPKIKIISDSHGWMFNKLFKKVKHSYDINIKIKQNRLLKNIAIL